MSNCSSADIAIATSCAGQSCVSGPPGRNLGKPSHQHVGQHVQPADQIELLEDHRASRAPMAQLPPAQRGDVLILEQDATRVRVIKRLIMRRSVDLPAPERPITPTKLPGVDRE